MSDLEIALADLGELTTRELTKKKKPYGLYQNKRIAKLGGHAAKVAKEDIEKNLEDKIVTSINKLDYKYVDNKK